jgi:tripartite-type tricarboxylate transporter receptor subunit TctC
MNARFALFTLWLPVLLLAFGAPASAQEKFPSRTVTVIVGFAPGGIGDAIGRQVADSVRERSGAAAVVEHRPGASSTIATAHLKRAKPDGYTVLLMSPSAVLVAPHFQAVGYDPAKDFTYLGQVMVQPMPMYVLSESRFRTYDDVLQFARANPGKFRWGTSGANGLAQILGESAFRREKIDAVTVPFKGGAEAITALLGGHIEAVISTDFGPQLAAGKVRLLVETGKAKAVPDVPTFTDRGYPLSVSVQYGIFAPAGLAPDVAQWWEGTLRDMVASPRYVEFAKAAYGVPLFAGSAELTSSVAQGYAQIGRAVKDLGLNTGAPAK